jgi:hypothetical protein
MYSLQGSLGFALVGQGMSLVTKANLQHLRDIYFDCLLACTGLVGIGLLMEILEIAHDVLEAIGRKSREHKYWLSFPIDRKEYPEASPRAKVLSGVGWVLIVLGVAGEGVFEGFVSKYDTALSHMTDTIVAEAQEESANAEATAKGFDAQIAESDAKAKSAEATAKQFEAQIADAKARAAQAELELAKIKQWRTLTPKQQQEIGNALSVYAGQNFAFLVFGDPESLSFLGDIKAALKIAGWNRVATPPGLGGDIGYKVDEIMAQGINDIGQDVFVSTDDTGAHPAALALAAAISRAGIHCEAHLSDWLKEHGAKVVIIRIGKKQP